MSKNILVIDDDEQVRLAFVLALEDEGFDLDTVESGEKGLEKIKGRKYNLIFLDLKMPGLNGVETLRELRKLDKEVPVYIVTAFHQEFFDQLKNLRNDGIHFELVSKPMNRGQIILVTNSILRGPQPCE